jgi:hypothetical protein
MYGLVQFEEYSGFPMSLVNGKDFLSRGSFVDESLEGLVFIGVTSAEAVVMLNSSRISVMHCP